MKIFQFFIFLLILIAGVLIGFTIKDFPYIKWNHEVKIYEVFQVCSTLFIGIAIPFFIKKWIDDSRIIKSLMVEEGKELIQECKLLKQKFTDCHASKSITADDKQHILMLFSQVENILGNYGDNLTKNFGNKTNSDYQDLKIAYYTYSNNITKGDLMSDSFESISLDFLNFHHIEYNAFIGAIRGFSASIQRM